MREEYEQLELDTRRQLDKAIAQLTEDTVKTAGEMITACGEAPTAVRNRHEAVSSICNSTLEAAATMIEAAAEMRRTLRDLYEAENTARSEEVTPMEEWASAAQFQDADPTDNTETEDE